MEQRRESGQHRHEEGRTSFVPEPSQAGEQRVGKRSHVEGAAQASQRRTRPVGRQIEYGEIAQLLAPIDELSLNLRRKGGITLPGRVIAIADWQRIKFRLRVSPQSVVELGQLPTKYADRPLVAGDMMQHYCQHMCFRAGAIKFCTDHGVVGEVERLLGFAFGFADRGAFPLGLIVDDGESRSAPGLYFLKRLIIHEPDFGAENFMPLDQEIESADECVRCKRTGDLDREGHIIGGVFRVERLDEPHPLLGV